MKRGIIITTALIIVLIVSIFLWQSHRNQMRYDMENHIESFYEYFGQAEVQDALDEAIEAQQLAERLRDSNTQDIINAYIFLSEEVLRGNEFFNNQHFEDALNTYENALAHIEDSAEYFDDLDFDFIFGLVTTTERHIIFNDFIERADSIVEQYPRDAMRLYQAALTIANSLSFEEGQELATAGIEHAEHLIILARLAEAAALDSQGDIQFLSGNYHEAIELLQSALEIYYELGMDLSVIAIQARIALAEQRIEELYRLAEEERRRLEEEERLRQEEEAALQDDLDDEAQEAISNYEHNRGIAFDLQTLIDHQNQPPASLIRMGTREGLNEGWYNGCGWVAAYNALIILGNPMHPAEIVHHFETTGGTVWDGVFGTFPHAIEGLFVELGYNVNHTLFPQVTLNLDNAIRNSRVAILAYMHTSAAHYIVIEYRPEDGLFIVYNDGFARRRSTALGLEDRSSPGAAIDSVISLIRETPDMLFSFSLITIN